MKLSKKMQTSKSMPERVNKISVLHKMIGLEKKVTSNKICIVPQNSVYNLQQKSPLPDVISKMTENSCDRNAVNKCPHCENMAKNFLYLESLIRNCIDKKGKCSLCHSSLMYLQYVNRNIMKVFGSFDSIVEAARAFATKPPLMPRYSVNPPTPRAADVRAKGGAVIALQKSNKSLKSAKLTKSTKTHKPKKSSKASKPLKSAKSKPRKALVKHKSKMSRVKGGGGTGGKMVLKNKYKPKTPKLSKQLNLVVRSASQYRNLRSMRSRLRSKAKKQKKNAKSTGIPWGLLKKNLPKRKMAS